MGVLSGFIRVVRQIPLKVWIILAAALAGVPSSIHGAQWVMYKFAKQETNCYVDLYKDPGMFSSILNEQSDGVQGERTTFEDCLKAADTKIGNLEFLGEEIKRSRR